LDLKGAGNLNLKGRKSRKFDDATFSLPNHTSGGKQGWSKF